MKEKFIEKRRIEQGREKKRIIGRKEEEGKNNEVKNKVTKRGKRKIRGSWKNKGKEERKIEGEI